MRHDRLAAAVLAVIGGLGLAGTASAVTWDNDSTDGLWATPSNWSGDLLPASGADVLFDNSGTGTSVGLAGTSRTVGTFDFTRGTDFEITRTGSNFLTINTALNVTGAGALDLNNMPLNGTDNPNSALLNVTGALTDVDAMTFGRISGNGTITMSSGGTNRLQLWQGVAQSWQGSISGVGTLELSHRDAVLTINGANGAVLVTGPGGLNHGTIVLDNSLDNNANRWTDHNVNAGNVQMNGHSRFKLIGNGTTGTTETGPGFIKPNSGGGGANAYIEVQSNGGQLAKLTSSSIDTSSMVSGAFLNYVGNDLGSTSRIVYTITVPAFLIDGVIGGYGRVGNEFATHDTGTASTRAGVTALSPTHASRVNQIEGADGLKNVLANTAQPTLSANTTINSLKIDGSHDVNLGGNDLTIDTGGLILAGGDATISGGTIKVITSSSAAPGGWLWITTQAGRELNIAADVAANSTGTASSGISKNGTGTLTLSGTLAAGTAGATFVVNWYEGSLNYQSDQNVSLPALTIGNGSLTKGGAGTMTISKTDSQNTAPNSFSGGVTLEEGTLIANTRGPVDRALGSGAIRVDGGAVLRLRSGTSVDTDSTALNDISGDGTIEVRGRISDTVRTLKSQGALWQPGSSAGVLTVDGNLSLEKSGADFSVLEIEIAGSGAVAGIDYDQLAISGTFAGLNANDANSTVDLVVTVGAGLDLTGDLFTILTTSSNLTNLLFHSVTWQGSATGGTVNYNNGSIVLSDVIAVPEPATLGLLALGGLAARRRRRRH